MLHLILPDPDEISGRSPERLVAHLGREPLLKNTTVVVRNVGLIEDKKQQALMQVGDCGTLVVQMNWLNGSHVSPPLGMHCDVVISTSRIHDGISRLRYRFAAATRCSQLCLFLPMRPCPLPRPK